VTLRDRDSMQQVRVKVESLPDLLRSLLNGSSSFASLKSV